MLEDTIIAVSTAPGYGGLGVVRISGSQALTIANKMFKLKRAQKKIPPCHPVLGNVYNFEKKEPFETAYLTFFPAPHTYTAEDVVEFSCHGSPVILEEVVRLGILAGARHATHGEFTLRAYIHGRIDILQAEAIDDMIRAPSLALAKISFRQMEGGLSKKIHSLRKNLTHLLSQIEACIEFPDDGLKISSLTIGKTLNKAVTSVQALIESYAYGKTLAEGPNLAITGRTNVGKSTLFNALLNKDRAIVSPYPGTTRDYLIERIAINGTTFTLIDMAGLDTPSHPIDKEGIKRGRRLASEADGVLILLDASRPETPEDIGIINRYQDKKGLILVNKIDLPRKMNMNTIRDHAPRHPLLGVSALKGTNLELLKTKIAELFVIDQDLGDDIILHLRQKLLLEDVRNALDRGLILLKEGHPEDMYGEEIRRALPAIGQLMGEIRSDDVLADIFERFCIGK
ncbi:MAG: tRNA uridine-5-carboxymethylaminomethyl(34) synthesis GTPase MnmE [Candidatus Aminicenantes bacterium]|nr:tRNA uridine-5-carboxymethylaminomethyl(34) synthesis GTPase MnmE [Candidatus Aminicenantes bacterium]